MDTAPENGKEPEGLGGLPPLGEIPETMMASVIRPERYGEPEHAFLSEEVPTPSVGPDEVLIGVMAAGINFNNVWAARGIPIDVVARRQRRGEPEDYHVGGSDCAGVVYAIGEEVDHLEVGDHVVTHPGWWSRAEAEKVANGDEMLAADAAIWGYDTNHGSFAQFALAKGSQVLPKPPHLTWEEAAAPGLVGTTAYRMLYGWLGHTLKKGDAVLVWGGSGGVGSQAIQIAVAAEARAVAVVSDGVRGQYCVDHGAVGYVDRTQFSHWGQPPHWDAPEFGQWMSEVRRFQAAVWDVLGERHDPEIVIEHPGEATVATSGIVCAAGGMVVICAGTTGYSATLDLRHHWVRQKRFQGSHGTNQQQAVDYNRLLADGQVDPCLGRVYSFADLGLAHQEMADGVDVLGNRVVLVGADRVGTGAAG